MIFTRTALIFGLMSAAAIPAWTAEIRPVVAEIPALRSKWRFSLPASTDAVVGSQGTLVIMGDRKGNLCAVSTGEGKELWRRELPAAVSSGPGFADGMILVGDEEGAVHALPADGGEALWSYKTGGKILGRPLVCGESVIVGSYDNSVHCLSLKTGTLNWSFATKAQVHAGLVELAGLVITGGCDGQLRGIDIASGVQKWSVDMEGVIAATPLIDGARVIVGTMDGLICAVDGKGQVAWKTTPLKPASPFTAAAAIVDGRAVFVADDGQIVTVRASDGAEVVTGKLQGSPGANVVAFGKFALVGTDDGKVEVMDPATAKVIRRITLGGRVRGLSLAQDMLLASTDEGAIWGLWQFGR